MTQTVRNISYLTKVTFDFSISPSKENQGIYIPANSIITHLSLEVIEPSDNAITMDVHIKDDVIGNDIPLHTKGTNIINFAREIKSSATIDVTLSAESNKGKFTLMAVYFLPSEINIEF